MHTFVSNRRSIWLSSVFYLSCPTPIHAPRPRPISYSIGVGTGDYAARSVDASTQGGPPPLELSSFLQDLTLEAMSSPVTRAPISVLSPNLQRYLDTSAVSRSPPPAPRIAISRGTSTRDEVQFVDVSVDVRVNTVNKAVQFVVKLCDSGTVYDPPFETPLAVSLPAASAPGLVNPDVIPSARLSTGSAESVVDPPEDFLIDGSLTAEPIPGTASSSPDSVPLVTSPMGPSLVASDDEAIATRLPGYLSSFNPVKYLINKFFIRFFFSFLPFFLFH